MMREKLSASDLGTKGNVKGPKVHCVTANIFPGIAIALSMRRILRIFVRGLKMQMILTFSLLLGW